MGRLSCEQLLTPKITAYGCHMSQIKLEATNRTFRKDCRHCSCCRQGNLCSQRNITVRLTQGLVAPKRVVRRAARWSASVSRLADGAAASVRCVKRSELVLRFLVCGLSTIRLLQISGFWNVAFPLSFRICTSAARTTALGKCSISGC